MISEPERMWFKMEKQSVGACVLLCLLLLFHSESPQSCFPHTHTRVSRCIFTFRTPLEKKYCVCVRVRVLTCNRSGYVLGTSTQNCIYWALFGHTRMWLKWSHHGPLAQRARQRKRVHHVILDTWMLWSGMFTLVVTVGQGSNGTWSPCKSSEQPRTYALNVAVCLRVAE